MASLNSDLAHAIVERCYQSGLLCFAPVGVGGGCIKINPPLCIAADALEDGLVALAAAFEAAMTGHGTNGV